MPGVNRSFPRRCYKTFSQPYEREHLVFEAMPDQGRGVLAVRANHRPIGLFVAVRAREPRGEERLDLVEADGDKLDQASCASSVERQGWVTRGRDPGGVLGSHEVLTKHEADLPQSPKKYSLRPSRTVECLEFFLQLASRILQLAPHSSSTRPSVARGMHAT